MLGPGLMGCDKYMTGEREERVSEKLLRDYKGKPIDEPSDLYAGGTLLTFGSSTLGLGIFRVRLYRAQTDVAAYMLDVSLLYGESYKPSSKGNWKDLGC